MSTILNRLKQQQSGEVYDNELQDLQRDIKQSLDKAKQMITQCKVPSEVEETHFITNSHGELIFPQFKNDINYNEEFWKTYFKNQMSFNLIKELSEKTNSIQQLVKDIQSKQQNFFKLYKLKNRKKNRRLAVQIEKKYQCPYQRCYKVYGSDVSLNLHIKLKHNGGNKTDRQKLAESICFAELNNKPMPQMTLQLPPGYLEQYRSNQFKKIIENGGIDRQQQEE